MTRTIPSTDHTAPQASDPTFSVRRFELRSVPDFTPLSDHLRTHASLTNQKLINAGMEKPSDKTAEVRRRVQRFESFPAEHSTVADRTLV